MVRCYFFVHECRLSVAFSLFLSSAVTDSAGKFQNVDFWNQSIYDYDMRAMRQVNRGSRLTGELDC